MRNFTKIWNRILAFLNLTKIKDTSQNDASDDSRSYSNRRDQSSLKGCCTAKVESMWKNKHINTFPGESLSKNRDIYMRDASSGDKGIQK